MAAHCEHSQPEMFLFVQDFEVQKGVAAAQFLFEFLRSLIGMRQQRLQTSAEEMFDFPLQNVDLRSKMASSDLRPSAVVVERIVGRRIAVVVC